MMHTARFEYERYGHNGYEGFKGELTAGGQNEEVYTHVLGMAGATVIANVVGDLRTKCLYFVRRFREEVFAASLFS